jgi:hypothetical protein
VVAVGIEGAAVGRCSTTRWVRWAVCGNISRGVLAICKAGFVATCDRFAAYTAGSLWGIPPVTQCMFQESTSSMKRQRK